MTSRSARILVVEDENIVGLDLQRSLVALGHTVVGVVATAEEAIRAAGAERPDLVLMDIRLRGEIDGVQAAVEIRRDLGVPVVFLTAYADQGTLDRAAEAQPFGYLVKPFDEAELQATIRTALQKHGLVTDLDRLVDERSAALSRTETRYRQMMVVAELGQHALRTRALDDVLERAVSTVCSTLGFELGEVVVREADDTYRWRRGVGWPPGSEGALVRTGPGPQIEPPPPGVYQSTTVVIPSWRPERPHWGLLGLHTSTHPLDGSEGEFVRAVANVIACAAHRIEVESELREAQAAAEQERLRKEQVELALRERDEFIAVAAHELRTPLNVLLISIGALEHAVDAPLGGPERERMARQIRRLVSLVELLLDVSRIASGALELCRQTADLGALVAEVVDDLRAEAERAGSPVGLTTNGPLDGSFDVVRMRQAVTNLVLNAVKYGAGAPVRVRVRRSGAQGVIEVVDRGVGIPEEDLPRIFGRFVRAAPVDNYGGLGLGLYVVRFVVEAHGGDIAVRSRLGRGTTFTVRVPLGGTADHA